MTFSVEINRVHDIMLQNHLVARGKGVEVTRALQELGLLGLGL